MRILLISHFGPLFQAEWIYKYLIKAGHSVVTVGKVFCKDLPFYKHTKERMGNNHLPLFWNEDYTEDGMPMYEINIRTILEMVGDDWDAIIECECYNLRVVDPNAYFHTFYGDKPYFFYKTELLEDHVSEVANNFFYAGHPILKKLRKLNPDVTNENSFYLPFTVNPDEVKPIKRDYLTEKYDLFFAGNSQIRENTKPEFKEAYAKRVEILDYLKEKLGDRFCYETERKWDYPTYLRHAQRAKILINVGIGCFNVRDFEAIAMGKPLITLKHSEYESNRFRQDYDLCMFETKEDALHIVKSLSKQNLLCKMISESAHNLFMENHHPELRVNDIIEAINDVRSRIESTT